MKTTPTNWHGLHKGLHWLVVLLLVMVWGAVELHEFYAKGDPMREWWKMLHFSLGLTILVVVLVRLYARTLYPRPAPVGAAWQRQLEGQASHIRYIDLRYPNGVAVAWHGETEPLEVDDEREG